MKQLLLSTIALTLLTGTELHATPNPLQTVTWIPPIWQRDTGKVPLVNLLELLEGLERQAAKQDELWFLELHFGSMRRLLETYPPSEAQVEPLIDIYSDINRGAGLLPYTSGNREFLLAYDSQAGGVLSYVRCTLPNQWNPLAHYPLYVWGRGGGSTPYPGDVISRYNDQINGTTIPGTPSAVYKNGFTIIPGGLGGRTYTGQSGDDFIEGIDVFRSHFRTDWRRHYMGGFSNGGKATYLIAAQTQHRLHWAALGMGAPAMREDATLTAEYAAPLANVPVWIAVGANDASWLQPTRWLRDLLTQIGNPPEHYLEQPGIGHTWIWDWQSAIYTWMNTKQYVAPGGAPAVPSNFRVTRMGKTSIDLAWELPEGLSAAHTVMLDRFLVRENGSWLQLPRAFLPPGTTGYRDFDLTVDQSYRYALWIYADSGDSPKTSLLNASTSSAANDTWGDWPLNMNGYVDTGSFIGWVYVASSPWVFSVSLKRWVYLPENHIADEGAWAYLPTVP
jgi:hypothetical protein